jgi:hypothetical protein
LTQAIVDAFGIPAATAVANAILNVTATGLKNVVFQDAATDPVAAGQLQRNGTLMKWHNGSGVVTFATVAAPGGAIALAGALAGPGTSGFYQTSSATYTDVDPTNLKASVTIPVGSKFLLVWYSVTLGCQPNTIIDGVSHVSVLAAGSRIAQAGFLNTGTSGGVTVFNAISQFGVLANPTSGAQTIALQFRGASSGPLQQVQIDDPAAEYFDTTGGTTQGGMYNRARMMYVVTT